MSQDTIDTVARAICIANGKNPDECDNNVADGIWLPNWTLYVTDAKAALAAMPKHTQEPVGWLYTRGDDEKFYRMRQHYPGNWVENMGYSITPLYAEPKHPQEQGLREAAISSHNAIENALAWDRERNFLTPYKVRDPMLKALGSLRLALSDNPETTEPAAMPEPIAVREPFFYTRCEHCGWHGSSEQCHVSRNWDDADVVCPACDRIFLCDDYTPPAAMPEPEGEAVAWLRVSPDGTKKVATLSPRLEAWQREDRWHLQPLYAAPFKSIHAVEGDFELTSGPLGLVARDTSSPVASSEAGEP